MKRSPRTRNRSLAVLRVLAVLAACVALSSCGGASGPTQPITGSILVTSTPAGASVYLNGTAAGALTDGAIAVAPGTYTVSVKKPGYADQTAPQPVVVRANETSPAAFKLTAAPSQRIVLVDHFSNTSCEPCFEAEHNLESALKQLGVAVSYSSHLNWPSAADPFYRANSQQSDERRTVLQISYMPSFWVDGVYFDAPTNFDAMVARIAAAGAVPARYEIAVTKVVEGDSALAVHGTIRKTAETTGTDLLIVAVIETGIRYSAVNGIDHYDDIVRGYLPATTGDPFQLDVGAAVEFNNSLRIQPGWVKANLEVIATVRSAATGVVYQTGTTR